MYSKSMGFLMETLRAGSGYVSSALHLTSLNIVAAFVS